MIKDIMLANEAKKPNSKEIAILHDYFPSCFTSDDKFDIERFKDFLDDKISVTREGYELRFLGKSYARLLASVDSTCLIVPDEEHNKKKENVNSQNIYISGDNLDGLKELTKSYGNSIKCIYIDPPYNTGSDGFVYNDKFNFTVDELTTKLSISEDEAQRILDLTKRGSASHSAWLMFMYPRLLLARDLLTQDGSIFISIDDNELNNLKLICDDIFEESNYVNTITVHTKASSGASGGGEDKRLKKNCEFILWYSRNKDKLDFVAPIYEKDLMEYIDEHRKNNVGFYYTRVLKSVGSEKEIGTISAGKGDEIHIYEHCDYELSTIGKICKEEKLSESEAYFKYFDKIFMVTNAQTSILTNVNDYVKEKNKLISYKYIPKSGRSKGKEETKYVWNKTLVVWLKDSAYKNDKGIIKTEQIGTFWDDISWGRLDTEGDMPYKNGKKPTTLIRRIINMVTKEGDTVLDFFSGSASTAHACMLESVNGKTLHSISIQIQEDLDLSYENASKEKRKELKKIIDKLDSSKRMHSLDEIGQERIERSAKQILSEYPNAEGIVDLGFKHYTLKKVSDNTLDKIEKFDPNDQGMFLMNNILDDFGEMTVLSTWLVRDGYGFNASVREIDFAGYKGFYIDKHLYLIEPDMTKEAVIAIVEQFGTDSTFNPKNVVIFGYCFLWTTTEELKVNLKKLNDSENNCINFVVRY